jgi:hypothetical protein
MTSPLKPEGPARTEHMITDEQLRNNLWVATMLRRYNEQHPNGLARYRTQEQWVKLTEWQAAKGETKPEFLSGAVSHFLQAGGLYIGRDGYWVAGPNRLGSDNPWSIKYQSRLHRVITLNNGEQRKSWIGEYSINRIRSLEEDVVFCWAKYDKEKARQEKARRERYPDPLMDPNVTDISQW